MLPNDVAIEEHPARVIESIKITRAEYLLIQLLRAIRKKSIVILDVGGDGVPKTFRAIEACIVDLH
jgi:hypothetical protein